MSANLKKWHKSNCGAGKFVAKKIQEITFSGKLIGIICFLEDKTHDVFEKIINRDNCDRLIGLANFLDTCVELANDKNLLFALLAECIEKTGNLGELIRSAEYAGIDFLFFCDPVTDIFNPNIVPSSQGVDDNYFNESFTQNCAILVDAEHSLLSNFWLKKDDAKKILLP